MCGHGDAAQVEKIHCEHKLSRNRTEIRQLARLPTSVHFLIGKFHTQRSHIAMAVQKKGQKQQNNTKRKTRKYTEKELNVPLLNTVAKPAAVEKKRKKGKVFVEDQSVLLSILAEVNDAKEGQIRSKLERVKDLEEVRERKRVEIEKKERSKAALIEKKKNELRSGEATKAPKSSKALPTTDDDNKKKFYGDYRNKKNNKSVSFDA